MSAVWCTDQTFLGELIFLNESNLVVDSPDDDEAVQIKGGMVGGRAFSPAEILRIADLPPREELLAKALGSMSAPMQGLVNVLSGVPRSLVNVLDSIRQEKAAAG